MIVNESDCWEKIERWSDGALIAHELACMPHIAKLPCIVKAHLEVRVV